jgi:hypothetical protein
MQVLTCDTPQPLKQRNFWHLLLLSLAHLEHIFNPLFVVEPAPAKQ